MHAYINVDIMYMKNLYMKIFFYIRLQKIWMGETKPRVCRCCLHFLIIEFHGISHEFVFILALDSPLRNRFQSGWSFIMIMIFCCCLFLIFIIFLIKEIRNMRYRCGWLFVLFWHTLNSIFFLYIFLSITITSMKKNKIFVVQVQWMWIKWKVKLRLRAWN